MTNFHGITPSSILQANRLAPPRKASASDYDFQPIEATADEPEAVTQSAEETDATVNTEKRHVPLLPQAVPPASPSNRNWLAYAGIGVGATAVGAIGAGVYKTHYLPYSKIELKNGWSKNTKPPEDVERNPAYLHKERGSHFFSDLKVHETSPLIQVLSLDKADIKNERDQKIKKVQWQGRSNDFKFYDYIEFYEGEDQGVHRGQIIPSKIMDDSSVSKMLILSSPKEDAPYAFIYELGKSNIAIKDIKHNVKKTVVAIKPPSGSNIEGEWKGELASLWLDLTKENKTVDEIHTALEAKGFTIEKDFAYNKTLPIIASDAFDYKSWEDVAKAAVKNDNDWWKLVPHEGMGKFIGAGALAGLAVAGAGIGLYEALKPKSKPSQPKFNQQG